MKGDLMRRGWLGGRMAGAVFLCLVVPAAIGSPITYVFSGPASGTLAGTAFTDAQVTITATADTANIIAFGGVTTQPCIPLASVSINIAGVGSATPTGPSALIADQTSAYWHLGTGTCSSAIFYWFNQGNPLAASYGLNTSLGPTTATQGDGTGELIPTTLGPLAFTTAPLVFEAILGNTTDQSDLWYIPAESGWGMQLVQRGTIIFATLFVYDQSGNPTWYVATLYYASNLTWVGTLYATNGTYFGVPWNPALFIGTAVGTMTWVSQTVETGTLTYVVNGTTVVKNVIRQTLVNEDYSGHYFGGLHDVVTGCPNAAANGTFDLGGIIDITQSGTAITIQNTGLAGVTCSYAGTLTQAGQMAAIPGAAFVCTDGSSGSISFDELQVNRSSMSGTFTATYSAPLGCQSSGWFGGFRGTTF